MSVDNPKADLINERHEQRTKIKLQPANIKYLGNGYAGTYHERDLEKLTHRD